MAIPIKHIHGIDKKDCVFCKTKTQNWHLKSNNPVCFECSKIHKVKHLTMERRPREINNFVKAEKREKNIKENRKREQQNLDSTHEDLILTLNSGQLPKANVDYNIGEEVRMGAIYKSVIVDYDDTKSIFLLDQLIQKGRDDKEHYNSVDEKYYQRFMWASWMQIKKKRTISENESIPVFAKKDDLWMNFLNSDLSSIFSMAYSSYAGIDMNPEYQRGNVWKQEDKISLFDSIFNNIDIGKFCFVKNSDRTARTENYYEVLDGKQRLEALKSFKENRYPYRGLYYQDLSWQDQNHIQGYGISYCILDNATDQDRIRYFLKLNTGGKLVDPKHLEKVQKMLK